VELSRRAIRFRLARSRSGVSESQVQQARRESIQSVRSRVELSRRALRFRLTRSRSGVRPNPEHQKPRYVQSRSQHHQEQCARHSKPRGNVPDNKQKGEARVERSFTLGVEAKAARQLPGVQPLLSARAETPVGPSGTEQGTGGVSKGVILESAASVHRSLRTATLP